MKILKTNLYPCHPNMQCLSVCLPLLQNNHIIHLIATGRIIAQYFDFKLSKVLLSCFFKPPLEDGYSAKAIYWPPAGYFEDISYLTVKSNPYPIRDDCTL